MSSSGDNQSPKGSSLLTSPEDDQYQYSNYPASGHPHFFPPPLPALPGPALHMPHAMHQHGYFHPYSGSSEAAHLYNGSPGTAGFTQGFTDQSAFRSGNGQSHGGSPQPASRDDDRSHAGGSPVGSETSPSWAKNSSIQPIQPPGNDCKTTPHFGQPPPLPSVPGTLMVSPNDPRQPPTPKTLYQNSPYYSEAPDLNTGSGSSESSSSSTNRPVPARSAFMCFSEAKGKEISEKNGVDGSKVSVEANLLGFALCIYIEPASNFLVLIRRQRAASLRRWR